MFPRFFPIAGLCLVAALAQQPPPPPSRLSSFDRGNSLSMLKMIKDDLTKNYYDPAFRGMDVEKKFADAAERLKTAGNVGEATAILADVLLTLDDSHTKFFPPERLTRVAYGWSATMIGDVPYVTFVKKASDAERKGLAVGDRVLAWNRFEPTRANLWQIYYGIGSVAFFGTSITVADLQMSDGGRLEKVGVTPDETVLPTGADLAAERDPVLARAITLLGGTMTAEAAGRFYRQ